MKLNKKNKKKIAYGIFVLIGIIAFFIFKDERLINIALKDTGINIQDALKDTNETNITANNFTEATIKRVVDGDTIVVTINNTDYKVRLIGVNTPESTTKVEEFGVEASNYTKSVLTTGKTVFLEKDVSETDKYGRLLRYVWLENPISQINDTVIKDKMFNAHLLLNGYAQVATYPPDVKYVDYFTSIQKEAKEKNVGLWRL